MDVTQGEVWTKRIKTSSKIWQMVLTDAVGPIVTGKHTIGTIITKALYK